MLDLVKLKKAAQDRWLITEMCQGKNVLELGCINHSIEGIEAQKNDGTWLFDYLKKYSNSVTGIDIDEAAIKYLSDQGYDVSIGDAQNFDLGKKFDVIVASKLIDHLLNLEGFLKSCQRHLTENGMVIISDDNILCLPKLFIWFFRKRLGTPDSDITLKPIPDYFKNFVDRFDLKVEEVKYIFPAGSPKLFKIFEKITPGFLIYKKLFYPGYILVLKRK